jgi:hypothetical protein
MHFLLILGVSETAVSGVLCPSLAVTGVSMAAELGTGVGVLRFDVMTVTVPVPAISMLRETVIRHQGLFWRVIGEPLHIDTKFGRLSSGRKVGFRPPDVHFYGQPSNGRMFAKRPWNGHFGSRSTAVHEILE